MVLFSFVSNPNNPFDTSIPDPFAPEQMIEDPMHGPSAVHGMLEIPEMPLGDGTYYQPGGFYAVGTPYFDASGQPVYRIGSARTTSALMREIRDLDEWREASQLGDEFLTALEGQRQRQRMDKTGVAHAFKPNDVCGGGKRLSECETAATMIQGAKDIATNVDQPSTSGEDPIWNVPIYLSRTCGSCALSYQVAYQTKGGVPTGITRFTTARPLDDINVIHIDVAALRPAEPTDQGAGLRETFRRLQELGEGMDQE